jgi:transcriptional regulator with XRE-family HTH domain
MEELELRRILSANIKRYRGLREWTQVKLAEKLDISTNFLADIETCKSWVSSLTLIKLANVLEIEVYELFKPEKTAQEEVKEIMTKFVRDVSISFNRSLGKVAKKYLS